MLYAFLIIADLVDFDGQGPIWRLSPQSALSSNQKLIACDDFQ